MLETKNQIERFLDGGLAEGRLGLNTLKAQESDLKQVYLWLDKQNLSVTDVTHGLLQAYLILRRREGLAHTSLRRITSSLRSFFGDLHTRGEIPEDPTRELSQTVRRKHLPDFVSARQVAQLLETLQGLPPFLHRCKEDRPARAARLNALIYLLFGQGLRISEAVSLRLNRLDWSHQLIRIEGKGGRYRNSPMLESTALALDAWLLMNPHSPEHAPKSLPQTQARKSPVRFANGIFVFPANIRQSHERCDPFYLSLGAGRRILPRAPCGHWSRQDAARQLKDLAFASGLDSATITAHKLRHGFATELLDQGASLPAISRLLGHADLGTTEIYTHVRKRRLKSMVDQHHPLFSFNASKRR